MISEGRDPNENKTTILELYNEIQSAVRRISLARLKEASGWDDIVPSQPPMNQVGQGNWIILMISNWYGMRLVFSCHFLTQHALQLAEGKLNKKGLSTKEAHDFIAEYCNLTVGAIKSSLSALIPQYFDRSGGATLSLPDRRADYDVEELENTDASRKVTWSLAFSGGELSFSSALELNERELLHGVKDGLDKFKKAISTIKIVGTGEVEFF